MKGRVKSKLHDAFDEAVLSYGRNRSVQHLLRLFVRRLKEVAEFYSVLCIREGIASGKDGPQTMTNQRRLAERSTERRSSKMADSSIRTRPSSALSFDFVTKIQNLL